MNVITFDFREYHSFCLVFCIIFRFDRANPHFRIARIAITHGRLINVINGQTDNEDVNSTGIRRPRIIIRISYLRRYRIIDTRAAMARTPISGSDTLLNQRTAVFPARYIVCRC